MLIYGAIDNLWSTDNWGCLYERLDNLTASQFGPIANPLLISQWILFNTLLVRLKIMYRSLTLGLVLVFCGGGFLALLVCNWPKPMGRLYIRSFAKNFLGVIIMSADVTKRHQIMTCVYIFKALCIPRSDSAKDYMAHKNSSNNDKTN